MNVLEKIFEELEERGNIQFSSYSKPLIAVEDVLKIIRSHMDDEDNDGWISVEDGLPEEGEEVEVTIEEMADSAGGMRYYTKTAWVQEERWVIKRNPCNPRVIAWRPLPEPYKPKKLQTEEKPV